MNQKCYSFSHKENIQKHIPIQENYVQTNCSNVAPMFFKSIRVTVLEFV